MNARRVPRVWVGAGPTRNWPEEVTSSGCPVSQCPITADSSHSSPSAYCVHSSTVCSEYSKIFVLLSPSPALPLHTRPAHRQFPMQAQADAHHAAPHRYYLCTARCAHPRAPPTAQCLCTSPSRSSTEAPRSVPSPVPAVPSPSIASSCQALTGPAAAMAQSKEQSRAAGCCRPPASAAAAARLREDQEQAAGLPVRAPVRPVRRAGCCRRRSRCWRQAVGPEEGPDLTARPGQSQ